MFSSGRKNALRKNAGTRETESGAPALASKLSPPKTNPFSLLNVAAAHSAVTAPGEIPDIDLLRAENYTLTQLLEIHKQSARKKSDELEALIGDLRRSGERDRQRAWILEMVSSHAPVTQTLAEITALATSHPSVTAAAVWTAGESGLSLQAAAHWPGDADALISSVPLGGTGDISAPDCALFENKIRQVAAERGEQAEFVLLRDGKGEVIGLLAALGDDEPKGGMSAGVLMQMAHLASLAIESVRLHQRLAFHAQHDILTGLPNRLLFQQRLELALARAETKNEQVAVLWIDLDRYKQINDTLGHTAGDELLCEVGRRLRTCVHQTDTVARFGGDEFTIVISSLVTEAVVANVAARVLDAIVSPMTIFGHEVRISASIGMSLYPDHGREAGLLMRNADLGMYHAKRGGRNQYQMFLPEFGNSLQRKLRIEEQLRNALENDEFHLEYQPLIDLEGQIAGMEALLRWDNPVLGRVPPGEFIPVVEEMGLIVRIGEWVARTACRDGAEWIRSGREVAHLSINASALQVIDRDFSAMISRALRDFGFPANRLEIEVTETVLIRNLDLALDQIDRLRAMGIHFSIDDFGTGYSSLNQLRTLPVDVLKIDRSFVNDIEHLESNSLVRGIIALAHSLELTVVAEGIETAAQFDALKSMGCDRNQGFHLHRPMLAGAMMNLLKRPIPAER